MSIAGIVITRGYFTTLKHVESLNAAELERLVGYETGRLATGFIVVRLCDDQVIRPGDFRLEASTRWSEGIVNSKDPNKAGGNVERLLGARGQDVEKLKEKVAAFFARRGPDTPAKVLPTLRHAAGMKYPDGQALEPDISGQPLRGGVPQFYLEQDRRFIVVQAVA